MIEQIKMVQNNSTLAARLAEYGTTVRNYETYYRKKLAFHIAEGNLCAGLMLRMGDTGQRTIRLYRREYTYDQLDSILHGILADIERVKASYAAGVAKITAGYPDLVQIVEGV